MYFEIQVGQPSMRQRLDEEREDLSSAILAMFPETTEDAILLWNWIPVRLNYNADISVIIEDVLLMLDDLLKLASGTRVTYFGANTFRVEWSLRWAEDAIRIESNWEAVAGTYEALLNSRNVVEVKRRQFVCEWKAILKKILDALETSGIRIANAEQLLLLRRIEAEIPEFGRLYRVSNVLRP